MRDFFTEYMSYVRLDASEAPANYHRWACASIIGAMLGRQVHLPFGPLKIYPNQYIMLMGPPATKKGTVIGISKKILEQAGYTRFAADRTSKERFLVDMKSFDTMEDDLELLTFDAPCESYITAGEFVDFIGQGDIGFMMTLTNLWDNLKSYEHKKITGKSVTVNEPTINLLGGSTATTFLIAFPPEALGTGALSRLLLIHGESSGVKVAWPEALDELQRSLLVVRLREMKDKISGDMQITPEGRKIASEIYHEQIAVDDMRFSHYMQRRQIHLLKLSIILAACDVSNTISATNVIRANTMLAMAEKKMPKALGEFGASKYSDATNKVIEYLSSRIKPASSQEIWKVVQKDLNKPSELNDILLNLKTAEKIQIISVMGKTGYLPMHRANVEWKDKFLDLEWLTPQERL